MHALGGQGGGQLVHMLEAVFAFVTREGAALAYRDTKCALYQPEVVELPKLDRQALTVQSALRVLNVMISSRACPIVFIFSKSMRLYTTQKLDQSGQT